MATTTATANATPSIIEEASLHDGKLGDARHVHALEEMAQKLATAVPLPRKGNVPNSPVSPQRQSSLFERASLHDGKAESPHHNVACTSCFIL
jgi:hypothetical protein